LLLEPVRVRRVSLVALQTQGEVVALGAVEAEQKFGNGLDAVIAAVPQIVALFKELVLSHFLRLSCHCLTHLLLEV